MKLIDCLLDQFSAWLIRKMSAVFAKLEGHESDL